MLKDIYEKTIQEIDPYKNIKKYLKYNKKSNTLEVGGKKYNLNKIENIYVVGGGKATLRMAEAINDIIGDKIKEGVINVYGQDQARNNRIGNILLVPAGHPFPNKESINGAKKIIKILSKAGKKDMIITLISGGGSDLMALPEDNIPLRDYIKTIKLLKNTPLNIGEINTIRKHIDKLKGGKMRKIASKVNNFITIAISDVPTLNDDPSVIASGPTVGDKTTFKDAYNVLKKYKILEKVPKSILNHLEKGIKKEISENPNPDEEIFSSKYSQYIMIFNNNSALYCIKKQIEKQGYEAKIINKKIKGNIEEEVENVIRTIKDNIKTKKPLFLIWGGEPKVKIDIKKPGKGGRMSHFALLIAKKLKEENLKGLKFMAVSSDGIDGVSNISGGIVDEKTINDANEKGINIKKAIENFDSASILKKTRRAIKIGKTGTNVADIMVALILPHY